MATTARKAVAISGRNPAVKRIGRIPVWEGAEYPQKIVGERLVLGVEIQGPEWLHRHRRWSIRIGFRLSDEPVTVSLFLNMGDDPTRPRAGRQSNYYKAYSLANGGPPKRGEPMFPEVFLGKWFIAVVEECRKDSEGNAKSEDQVYSRVTKLKALVEP